MVTNLDSASVEPQPSWAQTPEDLLETTSSLGSYVRRWQLIGAGPDGGVDEPLAGPSRG